MSWSVVILPCPRPPTPPHPHREKTCLRDVRSPRKYWKRPKHLPSLTARSQRQGRRHLSGCSRSAKALFYKARRCVRGRGGITLVWSSRKPEKMYLISSHGAAKFCATPLADVQSWESAGPDQFARPLSMECERGGGGGGGLGGTLSWQKFAAAGRGSALLEKAHLLPPLKGARCGNRLFFLFFGGVLHFSFPPHESPERKILQHKFGSFSFALVGKKKNRIRDSNTGLVRREKHVFIEEGS